MEEHSGAYGFRLVYPEWAQTAYDLVDVGPDAPPVTFRWREACTTVEHDHADENRVAMGARGGSSFYADRQQASVTFDVPDRPEPDALIHPLGTVPLSVFARWRGDVTLHAGAFATRAGAWMLAGQREVGKSTMLATLAERGFPIVADDMLAISDGDVWSGPQCVDLRPDVADRFPLARSLGLMGTRPRFRLSAVAAAPSRLPLRGMFLLDWHDRPTVELSPMKAAERLQWLYSLDYIALMGPIAPTKLLDLAMLPAWRLLRPRTWDATDDSVTSLLRLTEKA